MAKPSHYRDKLAREANQIFFCPRKNITCDLGITTNSSRDRSWLESVLVGRLVVAINRKTRLSKPRVRIALLASLVLVALVIMILLLSRIGINGLVTTLEYDYRAYWAGARLLITQGNPYDRAQLLAIEQVNGSTLTTPLVVWNPPWALIIIAPFALIAFPFSMIIWSIVNILLILICGVVLWYLLAIPGDRRYLLGIISVAAYIPTIQALILGQVSPWLLVSITGFLVALKYNRDGLAGAALSLQLIKPHVGLLLLVAVFWWALHERRWKILLGIFVALGVACAAVGIISPAVFGQFLHAESGLPLNWRSSSFGTFLRSIFGWEQIWLQFLPTVIGIALFLCFIILNKGKYALFEKIPAILIASVIFAAYGWCSDQVILLPVVIVFLSRLRLLPSRQHFVLMSLYVLTQVGLWLLSHYSNDGSTFYLYPLVLAGLYIWQRITLRRLKSNDLEIMNAHSDNRLNPRSGASR